MPELIVQINKIEENARYLVELCQRQNLELMGVMKGCHPCEILLNRLQHCGFSTLGFSRPEVMASTSAFLRERPTLIALPKPRHCKEVIKYFSHSYHSSEASIRRLAQCVNPTDEPHGVILMIEVGDFREGVLPKDAMALLHSLKSVWKGNFRLAGIACNYGCCSGTLPSAESIQVMAELAENIKHAFHLENLQVSIGGSVVVEYLEQNPLPPQITQIRAGEAVLLGNIPCLVQQHQHLNQDTFLLRGEVLEVAEKELTTFKNRGRDALGRQIQLTNTGKRKRAIIDFGDVDTDALSLTPTEENVKIVTSNSDYTILDITDCPNQIRQGDRLLFQPNYRSLIRAFMSPFTQFVIST